jgi:hypothetical protein
MLPLLRRVLVFTGILPQKLAKAGKKIDLQAPGLYGSFCQLRP